MIPQFAARRIALAPVIVFALATLFLAGIVHIVVILLVPRMAENDGWSRLAAVAAERRFGLVTAIEGDGSTVPGLDPLFVHGACRINISLSPARLALVAADRFWSLAIYDENGTAIFSLNDRTAAEGVLQMLIVTPLQNAELRESDPAALAESIAVESEKTDLIALIRLYAPSSISRDEARAILNGAACTPEAMP